MDSQVSVWFKSLVYDACKSRFGVCVCVYFWNVLIFTSTAYRFRFRIICTCFSLISVVFLTIRIVHRVSVKRRKRVEPFCSWWNHIICHTFLLISYTLNMFTSVPSAAAFRKTRRSKCTLNSRGQFYSCFLSIRSIISAFGTEETHAKQGKCSSDLFAHFYKYRFKRTKNDCYEWQHFHCLSFLSIFL